MAGLSRRSRICIIMVAMLASLFWVVRMRQESYAIVDGPTLLSGPDFKLYYSSFDRVQHGEIPGINFFVEYPPLAPVGWLAGPLLLHANSPFQFLKYLYYQNAAIALLLLVMCCYYVVRKDVRFGSGILSICALLCGLYVCRYYVVSRYDIVPAALLFAFLVSYQLGRDGKVSVWHYVLYLLSIAMKLYPVLLLPFILSREYWKQNAKRICISAAVVSLLNLPFFVFGHAYILEFLNYHSSRNIEIGSTWALVGLLCHVDGGSLNFNFGSYNFDHGFYALASKLSLPLVLGSWGAFWLFVRKYVVDVRSNIGLIAIVVVCLFVLLGKVWSPQYMVWLVTLIPLANCRIWSQVLISASIIFASWGAATIVSTNFPDAIVRLDPYVVGLFCAKVLSIMLGITVSLIELRRPVAAVVAVPNP